MRYLAVHLRFPDAAIHVIQPASDWRIQIYHKENQIYVCRTMSALHTAIWQSRKKQLNRANIKLTLHPLVFLCELCQVLKWFVVDNGKSNKQKCVQRRAKLFLCIHLIPFWNEVSVWRQAYKNLLPARREPAGNSQSASARYSVMNRARKLSSRVCFRALASSWAESRQIVPGLFISGN